MGRTNKWNKKLEWYAFIEDFNSGKLGRINVIRQDLIERIRKGIKSKEWAIGDKPIETLKELKEVVKRELMYHFWSKAEYEVIVTGLHYRPEKDKEHKIDVWYQLEPNLDRIVEYINKELELGLK